MPTLFNRKPKNSYQELLKLTNTGAGLDTTLRTVEDGVGQVSPLSLSTTQIALSGLIWPTTVPLTGQILSVGAGDQLVWTDLTGAESPVQTYQGVLGTTNTTLATVSTKTLIQEISLCNTTITDATFSLYIVPSGATLGSSNAIFYNATILAGQTVVISTDMTMLTNGTVQGSASVSGVNVKVSGNTASNIQRWYWSSMPTVATAVYTVPTATTNTIASIIVCNPTGLDQTFSLYFTNGSAASAANAYINNITISANTTVLADLATVLTTGSTVTAVGSSSGLSLMVNGF
jgi:hypothetical protein